jgi:peptidoglycan/LPS O-acetylase OafA/YrhL
LIWLSELGKVCVAIFVFCSGYGLSVSYPESIQRDNLKAIVKGSIRFEIKRLIKFYSNYWIVFLIFVPISVFCFGRSLSMPYGNDSNIILSLILDLFGLQGLGSFNITWWFNKLILLFYFCFPILWWACRKGPIVTLFFFISCLFTAL